MPNTSHDSDNPQLRTATANKPPDISTESVDELRERLERMKKMMAQRQTLLDGSSTKRKETGSPIDGNVLSLVFGSVLFIIVSVSTYAFYNLFWAIIKRHVRYHEEL